MFDPEVFSSLFNKEKSLVNDEDRIEQLLDCYQESPEEREERRRLIDICHQVMIAERYEDVDVPLEDLIKLANVYEDVKELYCSNGSGEKFRDYKSRLSHVKSLIKRRVL